MQPLTPGEGLLPCAAHELAEQSAGLGLEPYASAAVFEPDEMGVWSESGQTVWLPRSRYPRRYDAIRWAMSEWGCSFLEVRARVRYMAHDPTPEDGSDLWIECERDHPGAFLVWRLEGARGGE